MLRFSLFGFPVSVHWFFWLVLVLLGNPESASSPLGMQLLVAWVAAGFFSVLLHELGHAVMMRRFGDPRVEIYLVGFGGFARGSRWFSRTQNIWVSAAGPLVQLAAGLLTLGLLKVWTPNVLFVIGFLTSFMKVSIFWSLINLLPIIPMDGGQISRGLFGPMRQRQALVLSLCCAAAVALLSFRFLGLFSLMMFGLMALNNWKELQGEPQIDFMNDGRR